MTIANLHHLIILLLIKIPKLVKKKKKHTSKSNIGPITMVCVLMCQYIVYSVSLKCCDTAYENKHTHKTPQKSQTLYVC